MIFFFANTFCKAEWTKDGLFSFLRTDTFVILNTGKVNFAEYVTFTVFWLWVHLSSCSSFTSRSPKVQQTPQWLLFLIKLGWTIVHLIRLLNITCSAKPLTNACALYVIVWLMNGIAAWTIHPLFCLNISDLIWCSCGLWGQALL